MRPALCSLLSHLSLAGGTWSCQGAQPPASPREPAPLVNQARATERVAQADPKPALPGTAVPGARSAKASTSSTPGPASEEARVRALGNTRGQIACGSTLCETPKEQCVSAGNDWRCVPSGQAVDAETQYACDDASDCQRGQTCCLSFVSAFNRYACSPRSGSNEDCRLEICVEQGGAACPKGQRCRAGVCLAPARAATCEGGKRCAAETPICVFSNAAGHCTAALEAQTTAHDGAHAALACSNPSDCGTGSRCCTNALWDRTSCLTNCDAANNGQLCTSDSDCSNLAVGAEKARCLRAQSADVARALPSWVRFCSVAR